MIEQDQVNDVCAAVLAQREPVELEVDHIDPALTSGEVLMNLRTGDHLYVRYVDRERSVVAVDPPLLHG